MAEVAIDIAGRAHAVVCRDGEEARLIALSRIVSQKAEQVASAMGGVNEARQLLLAALLLADELADLRGGVTPAAAPMASPPPSDTALTSAIERLAGRVEAIAERLEA